ncbi:MAG: ArsR family transcriptional regulator [Candidatus Thermoplasmatota archaeon]|jgi:predicted DNA-binding ArsR family transcriptional regulator|nr:ArsR family transcriptional regulator [Candidatus Thermoplasmatota archaeon]
MMRTKVVNDSTDLVPLLRAFDNKVKKEVFNEVLIDWKPLSEIIEKYGQEGEEALEYFDKMKLVETKWTTPEEGINGKPQKKYRSYYSAFSINISCPVNEISEIFTVASLSKSEFEKLEEKIYDFIGEEGKFGNMVAENFNLSNLALKGLVKRSNKFCYKGLKLSRKE